jgi:hypothetical protein
VQRTADQSNENPLDMRVLQAAAMTGTPLFLTRNEMRSAVRVRSSALLMPLDEQEILHRKGPDVPVGAWQQ